MTEHRNEINIGGDVGGNFVVGNNNNVGVPSVPHSSSTPAALRLFVSYRINDSVYATAGIADRLARHFGRENVFRDRDTLALGAMYPTSIRRALERCDTVLAVIGSAWLEIRDSSGQRCLDNPRDWVRTELRMAFERGIPVVPVLLDDTPLPDPSRLPDDLAPLTLCTFWQVRHQSFDSDVRGLIDGLTPGRNPSRPT
ncbi:MAG: toll/interleukin-1 receptor domain-containing protein [Actinophytocola sp.]|uniref:toll/interleukin-1 receptor domain-containing protein n=1 Tax=Actinophytocola sp. TaxID=1872138 RepID=UPI003D6A4F6E